MKTKKLTKKTIKVDGRELTITVRGKQNYWYIRIKDQGVNRRLSMKTDDVGLAIERAKVAAKEIFKMAFAQKNGLLLPNNKLEDSGKAPTCGQVHDVFLAERFDEGLKNLDFRIKPKAIRDSAKYFRDVITVAFPKKQWRKVLISDVAQDEVCLDWRRHCFNDVGKIFGADDDLKLNRSLNAKLRQARAVVSKGSRSLWKKRGWLVPDAIFPGGLLSAGSFKFKQIPKQIDEAMQAAANDPKHKDYPGAEGAVVYQIARYTGATSQEIGAMQWDWFDKVDDTWYLDIGRREGFTTKWDTKDRRLPVKAQHIERWKEVLGVSDPVIGRIIKPGKHNCVYRDLSKWIAGYIPDRQKRLHEVRKQAGSDYYSKTKDPQATSDFMGDSLQTTFAHYVEPLDAKIAL
jgi:integrase